MRLLNGQLVDVFKSSPDYDFQGGTPYAVTDIGALSLMICTAERIYVLFGAGVDTTDEDVAASYRMLIDIYNRIQADKDASINAQKGRPLFQLPQINIQLPKVELPKLEIPQIRIQSPFVFGKKKEEPEINEPSEKTPNDSSDHK